MAILVWKPIYIYIVNIGVVKVKFMGLSEQMGRAVLFVKDRLNSGKSFALDTNILILLVESGDNELLDMLINSPNYIYTNINDNEIYGLAKFKRFEDHRLNQKLLDFQKRILIKKNPRHSDSQDRQLKSELNELVSLLPRKVVADFLIGRGDSLLRKLINRFKQTRDAKIAEKKVRVTELLKPLGEDELNGFVVQYQKDVTNCMGDMIEYVKLQFKDKGIDIAKVDFERYKFSLSNFMKLKLGSIRDELSQAIFVARYAEEKKTKRQAKNTPLDIGVMISILEEFARKSYESDVKFVAQMLALGVEGGSQDNDVISLFELHAAKKVLT